MKYLLTLIFALLLPNFVVAQSIELKGTIFDPNGAVVVGAEVTAIPADGKSFVTKTGNEGDYSLKLVPGTYRLEFQSPGFRRNTVNEYLVVDSAFGTMHFDVVLLVPTGHEPCGDGGHCIEIPSEKETINPEKISPRSKTGVNSKTNKKPR